MSTRTIGGGIFNEWGWVQGGKGNTYPDTLWVDDWYWTQDTHTTGTHKYIVRASTGHVNYRKVSTTYCVACFG